MSSIKINRETTLAQLIELGLIKPTQVTTWEKRANRQAVNARVKAKTKEKQTRLNQAVACYIGANYGYGFENRFRKKPIEKALLKDGISRSMIDKAIATMVEEGSLVNNSDSVNNQCHTRHWRPQPEATDSES